MHAVVISIVLLFTALSGAFFYNHAEAPAEVSVPQDIVPEEKAASANTPTSTVSTASSTDFVGVPTQDARVPEGAQEESVVVERDRVAPQEPAKLTPTEENFPKPQAIAVPDKQDRKAPPRVSEPLVVERIVSTQVVSLPDLHAQGVLGYTNAARFKNGLELYAANDTLARIAARKMQDMFDRQYFAHEAPDGRDVANLAQEEGYEYLLVGENLAVGGFHDNEHLVDEWLNSPGHRANILSGDFTEIGVAVGRGIYKGNEVWMSVQTFGLPRNACPAPDTSLLADIERSEVSLAALRQRIEEIEIELQDTRNSSPLFREQYEVYQTNIQLYNKFIEEQRDSVATYNQQVKSHNDCLADLR